MMEANIVSWCPDFVLLYLAAVTIGIIWATFKYSDCGGDDDDDFPGSPA